MRENRWNLVAYSYASCPWKLWEDTLSENYNIWNNDCTKMQAKLFQNWRFYLLSLIWKSYLLYCYTTASIKFWVILIPQTFIPCDMIHFTHVSWLVFSVNYLSRWVLILSLSVYLKITLMTVYLSTFPACIL